MKDIPILFNGQEVRAILDDFKTQTRRVSRLEEINEHPNDWEYIGQNTHGDHLFRNLAGLTAGLDPQECTTIVKCPYGQPGERLWVRETFQICSCIEGEVGYPLPTIPDHPVGTVFYRATDDDPDEEKWRPAIHMPRWASRITLENIGVRVERLEDITEADAKAEGVLLEHCTHPECGGKGTRCAHDSYRGAFAVLWNTINAKTFPWGSNPWVRVVNFRRVKQ